MKDWDCAKCGKNICVPDDYHLEYCCSGHMCGCMGYPINPVYCDACAMAIYGNVNMEEAVSNAQEVVDSYDEEEVDDYLFDDLF